ncbi:hypothetical protein VDGL01_09615 [Verticillium dahliae]
MPTIHRRSPALTNLCLALRDSQTGLTGHPVMARHAESVRYQAQACSEPSNDVPEVASGSRSCIPNWQRARPGRREGDPPKLAQTQLNKPFARPSFTTLLPLFSFFLLSSPPPPTILVLAVPP